MEGDVELGLRGLSFLGRALNRLPDEPRPAVDENETAMNCAGETKQEISAGRVFRDDCQGRGRDPAGENPELYAPINAVCVE